MSRKKKREVTQSKTEEPQEQESAQDPAPEVDPAEEWREKYLRTLAELDNFRKRAERERARIRKYAAEDVVRDLLPVLDALELASSVGGGADAADAVQEGVGLALSDARRILGEMGVQAIAAVDQPFDPRFHEAVGVLPDPERPPNTVAVEERRGYLMHDRVLRPSRVQITVAPPQPESADANQPTVEE